MNTAQSSEQTNILPYYNYFLNSHQGIPKKNFWPTPIHSDQATWKTLLFVSIEFLIYFSYFLF